MDRPSDQQSPHSKESIGLRAGLDAPLREHGHCGVGALVNLMDDSSHDLVAESLDLLENLDHRGARGAEQSTGDGAGIMLQIPCAFFAEEVSALANVEHYAVGQCFLPQDASSRKALRERIERIAQERGFEVLAWRRVPTNNSELGPAALQSEPAVEQCFVAPRSGHRPDDLDARLYILRRALEKQIASSSVEGAEQFYVCSLDRRTIVYKGLLTNAQLRQYYPDLRDGRVRSSLAVVHSRFSTNTLGSWPLAHPYRMIAHNGEINTLRGNLNSLRAREADLAHPAFGNAIDTLRPVASEDQSDTATLDNALELLVRSGRSLPHALRMLMPPAWQKDASMDTARRSWHDYHRTLVEPWDGPALVVFTDGNQLGATLDRNGLRPCRYTLTTDHRFILASETGALDVEPQRVAEKGRLGPGQMMVADPTHGRILDDEHLMAELTDDRYATWLDRHRMSLDDIVDADAEAPSDAIRNDITLQQSQRAFGYTSEAVRRVLQPMAEDAKDPVGAMGDDTPPSVFSKQNKPLFTYFKQLFAQVSNPPIDYIREELVTALDGHVGRQRNLLDESPEHCRQLHLPSPILQPQELRAIQQISVNGIRSRTLDLTFEADTSMQSAVDRLQEAAETAVREGIEILVLSDRGLGPNWLALPSLLAVGAVHHHLIREGLRTRTGLVLDSGQPFGVHDVCTLLGYGADALYPYLAYATLDRMAETGALDDAETARANYIHALENGVLKVMSKMGISTLESYKGAQVFEAVGLNSDFVDAYFYGTTSRIEGIGVGELEDDVRARHHRAFQATATNGTLDPGGDLYWRRDGEFHQWNPHTIADLQHAVRSSDYERYRQFARRINEQNEQLQTLRGLLEVDHSEQNAIPIGEVEPVDSIVQRFFTASMSFGSLSEEAHETLAIAMNRLGARASSGEGGEQVERFGTERACKIKQVASGRFGVTSTYLRDATDLEIKMAQGSKPGEGGHLPGEKVNDVIARTRYTMPGVSLISPPPHHDIYSIEDLAQLIYDLKCANADANVHVKLVSEAGIGVIAAGVAKAKADAVLISGHSGGTGASPKTSIKSAGLPWELGLAEAQQILRANRLRSRIRVRVDGGLKTGRDVVVAALLGAEEYGFGTAALVTLGCVMLRKCHCNTCSVGIATQDPELRDRFPGQPEHVIRYMRFIAREVREHMARLGFRTMDEMIGRFDRLRQKSTAHDKASTLDLRSLLHCPEGDEPPRQTTDQDHQLDAHFDQALLDDVRPALEANEPVEIHRSIRNRHRAVGTILSSEIARRRGTDGLPDDTIQLVLNGSAGQSFGAFLASGVTLDLTGDANDYVGKGLSGGKIIVRTPMQAGYPADANSVIGNVALYGATGGELYVNGRAGERFAVRNSGVFAVVEGIGDHGCEYMTGGVVVVLGSVGRNFGAGMSGGEAFVLDEENAMSDRVNRGMVRVENTLSGRDRTVARRMVENHLHYTGSAKARHVLDRWDAYADRFIKVMPEAYARTIEEHLARGDDQRVDPPQARRDPTAAPVSA